MPKKPAASIALARSLRKRMTKPERELWKLLSGPRTNGLAFRRQHFLIGKYYADFCCLSAKVVIEVDGAYAHQFKIGKDRKRDVELKEAGYLTLRVPAKDVLARTHETAEWIAEVCLERLREHERLNEPS